MSRGRITRASRHHPSIRRQASRYGRSVRVRRAAGLPPNLLPAVSDRQKRSNQQKFILTGVLALMTATIVATILFVISTISFIGGTVEAYKKVNSGLPNAGTVFANTFQDTKIYDRNGTLLQEIADPDTGLRTFVPFAKISPNLVNATVAAEDATFWTNYGVEPIAIVRGAIINASGAGTSGGSTITQQVVRALYPNKIDPNDISLTRKVKEALAAVSLAKKYSKSDIFTMYVNQIFYGNRCYGIEAAAQTYFNKHASELNLAEASLLAGIPQAPTAYNPLLHFDVAKKRQQYVLDQMVKYKYITQDQADATFAEPLQVQNKDQTGVIYGAPHFVDYVKQYIVDHYGAEALYHGGLNITTTLDLNLQNRAQEVVKEGVENVAQYNAHNGAMAIIQPWSGEILAMVGSADFNDASIDGQINMATALRQPGSSIKPVTYAAAFETGMNPGTVIFDGHFRQETPGADQPFYEPQNDTGLYYGAVTVRQALDNSLNIPAVKTLQQIGLPHMFDMARRLGLKHGFAVDDPGKYGLAITLGGGEVRLLDLANVYATFANNGRYVPANPILKVTDSQGHVIYQVDTKHVFQDAQQAVRAEYSYEITSILTDNKTRELVFGQGNLFGETMNDLGRPTAAKSGTTENFVDNWVMGYTTDVAIGVWVGNDDNTPLDGTDGISTAGPIWSRMMQEIHQNPEFAKLLVGPDGQPIPKNFPRPPGIVETQLCNATGHQASGGSSSHKEITVKGEGPALQCDQLSAYERSQLEGALKDVQSEPNMYYSKGPGVASVYRYAAAAGYDVPQRYLRNSDNDSSADESGDDSSDNQRILPRNGGNDNGDNSDSGNNDNGDDSDNSGEGD